MDTPSVPAGENPPFSALLGQFRADPTSLLRSIPGVWLVNKPSGPSSNLVVVRARKKLGIKKLGHAGTLDPLAEGLLVLLAGNATRLFDSIQEFPKSYRAEFILGERTDSQDSTGNRIADWQPLRQLPLAREEVEAALGQFRGEVMQMPPMHSALKRDGIPLYKLARQGKEVERKPRPAKVYSLNLIGFTGSGGTLDMSVSKGFYVRTLIDDLGVALGVGAVMTRLVRTAVGPYRLEDADSLDDLDQRGAAVAQE
ncbi:MAG: tRNA pseudouridine(55) synthase TruB [Planctomycetes bacterium]|nr:tRNA pseudouridine(55) synthase TruB [Planctomycetota bacterium]